MVYTFKDSSLKRIFLWKLQNMLETVLYIGSLLLCMPLILKGGLFEINKNKISTKKHP